MKTGDTLLCIKNHIYDDNRITFTKGKYYTITFISLDEVRFVDDEHDEWGFGFNSIHKYFKPKFTYGK